MRCTALLSVLILALARGASAQPAPPPAPAAAVPLAELDYQVGANLSCPTVEELRAEVSREMGYDPFSGSSGPSIGRFHVTATRGQGNVVHVDFRFEGAAGARSFDTEFDQTPATERTCRHLVRVHVVGEIATVLTVAMARLIRNARPRGSGRTEAIPACSAPLPCFESRHAIWPDEWPMKPLKPPEPDPPKPVERWPSALRFAVAAWPEVIAANWGSVGISAEVGARYRAFSAGVELHGDPPLGSIQYPNLNVSFARVSGALLLCGHYGFFAGCGVSDVGGLIFPSHLALLPASALYGAVGARVKFEFPIAPPLLFLSTSLDLRAPIHPLNYANKSGPIFETAALGGGLGLAVMAEISP